MVETHPHTLTPFLMSSSWSTNLLCDILIVKIACVNWKFPIALHRVSNFQTGVARDEQVCAPSTRSRVVGSKHVREPTCVVAVPFFLINLPITEHNIIYDASSCIFKLNAEGPGHTVHSVA